MERPTARGVLAAHRWVEHLTELTRLVEHLTQLTRMVEHFTVAHRD